MATILLKSLTSTSFAFTELTNTISMGEGSYITLFSPSDVSAFHRIMHRAREEKAMTPAIIRGNERLGDNNDHNVYLNSVQFYETL